MLMMKIDDVIKESAHQLSLDPSYSSHFSKIKFLTNLQEKLLKEEATIRATLA
jgi:hypothetical protein